MGLKVQFIDRMTHYFVYCLTSLTLFNYIQCDSISLTSRSHFQDKYRDGTLKITSIRQV